jgi:flagellar motor switch protein FliM
VTKDAGDVTAAVPKSDSPSSRPDSGRQLKRLDLTGRERRLRAAMQAMGRVAVHFARLARRTMPFLVKRRSRLVPGAVAFVDLGADPRVVHGPVFEVLLEEKDGPGWGCLIINADALAIILEGALGGAGDGASAALGSELTVAQAALVSKVVRQLADDLRRAVREEVGVALDVTLAHGVATGDERDAAWGDGLGVDCVFEGLASAAKVAVSMGAEALEAALKEKDGDEPMLGDPRMAEALHDVPVEIVAELGRVSLGLRRLLTLQPGQVLRLSSAVDDPAVIRVEGVAKFVGSPVISRGQLAIQIKARHED